MNEQLVRRTVAAIRAFLVLSALVLSVGCAEEDGDDCDSRTCNRAPAAFCTDSGQLATYDDKGTCQVEECAYALRLTDCGDDEVCKAGACVATP